jgi:outer membrane receptor protein involved in Fe transport
VRLPADSPLGNPDDSLQNRANRLHYKVSHSLLDDWTVHSRGSYENVTAQSVQWRLMPTPQGSVPMPMLGLGYRTDNRVWALSNDLTGTVRQGRITHALVLGWDEIQDRQDFVYPGAIAQAAQNPFDPQPLPPPSFVPGVSLSQTVRQSVFRLRDRIALGDRWEVSASVRANDYIAKLPAAQLRGLAWTPAFGLVYKLDRHTSWFADYSHGFQINTGYFYSGGTLQPERSRQLETGARWEDASRKLSAQVALYRIDANHVSLADMGHPGYYMEVPEQTSQGIELSLQGALGGGWETSLWLAYSSISGRLLNDQTPTAPAVNGAAWTTYTVRGGSFDGAGAGLGVIAQSGVTCYASPSFRIPGSMLFDGSLYWHRKTWRVDLIARNLFNARAYGNTLTSSFIPILPGRTLDLRLMRSF